MTHKFYLITLIAIMSFISQGCIHDYPHGEGEDPTMVELGVELVLNLEWKQFAEEAHVETRARGSKNHRITIEILRKGEPVGCDEIYLSDEEFKEGTLFYPLSFKLHALEYNLAVWYDRTDPLDEEGNELMQSLYEFENLSEIKHSILPLEWSTSHICGYANASLDLSPYRGKWGARVIKPLQLMHGGARFELITSDFQEFIQSQRSSLLQGETYTLTMTLSSPATEGFNAHTGTAISFGNEKISSRTLFLPMTDSSSVTIASGFILSSQEEDVTITLTVHNSAKALIIKTPPLTFPVKRGYLTRVSGEFLTSFFNSWISIDNIWAGEIEIEL